MDLVEANQRAAAAGFRDVRWVERTGSTNNDLVGEVRTDPIAAAGRVLVADEQTAGRGRLGRRWDAPPRSGLLCSMVVPSFGRAETSLVNLLVGVSARAAAERLGARDLAVKWPNDVVVRPDHRLGDRKVAGVLSELVVVDDASVVVTGIGINVSWPTDATELPVELSAAASLAMLGADIDRVELLVALLEEIAPRREALAANGPGELLDECRRVSATLGRNVRVDGVVGRASIVGEAIAIDDDGRLVVRRRSDGSDGSDGPDGSDGLESALDVTVDVGDVHHIRPMS